MNGSGKGIFYSIIGLATMIIAFIGASYAYFTVAAVPDTETIAGQSNDTLSGALSLSITKVDLGGTATSGDNLVPADFGSSFLPNDITTTNINKALTSKCVQGGYTGCHVWKIEATTTQTVTNANINLSLTATKSEANTSGTLIPWSYVVYTGTDTTATNLITVPSGSSAAGSFGTGLSNLDINNNTSISTTGKTYYLMVYINNADSTQNNGATDVRASYTGTVTFEAAGGQVKATFG